MENDLRLIDPASNRAYRWSTRKHRRPAPFPLAEVLPLNSRGLQPSLSGGEHGHEAMSDPSRECGSTLLEAVEQVVQA